LTCIRASSTALLRKNDEAAVSARDYEIADVVARKPLRSVDAVVEGNRSSRGHPEAERARSTVALPAPNLVVGKRGAGPGVTWWTTRRELRAPREVQLFRCAEAGIDPAGGAKRLDRFRVDRAAFALQIRPMRTATVRPLGPVETKPSQVVEQASDERRFVAGSIGVFDPQDEAAIATARSEIAEERCPRVAQMQITGRAGREACNG
jgi:hypothetical protein